jgi:hypothetical protein
VHRLREALPVLVDEEELREARVARLDQHEPGRRDGQKDRQSGADVQSPQQ